MKSYSSEVKSVADVAREVLSLHHLHSHDVLTRVRTRVADAHAIEQRIKDRFGIELTNLDVLEIGPGQFTTQMAYFGLRNRVVGVDRDVIVQGFDPQGYIRMLRYNGLRRTLKTSVRKLIGVDRRNAGQLRSYLGVRRLPRLRVFAMDVRALSFPRNSFDFIYSRAVLHHLPDPGAALDEIVRVLRPGGVVHISIHPYTSESGCLDPRIYTERRQEVAGWPHLRPALRDSIHQPNVHLNKLRLEEWRTLFNAKMPGCSDLIDMAGPASLDAALKLQSQGELLDYTLEELLAGEMATIWRKPSQG